MSHPSAPTNIPTDDEIHSYVDRLSNWGRWKESPELGTLNLISPAVRKRAAASATEGRAVALGRDIRFQKTAEHIAIPPLHIMVDFPRHYSSSSKEGGSYDFAGFMLHGTDITHVDALCHTHYDGHIFDGISAATIDRATGADRFDVNAYGDGVATRGVLIDIPNYCEVPWLEPGFPVVPDLLNEVLAAQGTELATGDAVLLRTGFDERRTQLGPERQRERAGWHASCLPWFHDHAVALIGADTPNDVMPSGYVDFTIPVHTIGIALMGLCLVDNLELRQLGQACADLGRYEFLFVMGPLRMPRATASPVNPMALL